MKPPDKIYIAFENGFVAQTANTDKDAAGNSIFLDGLKPYEYIRKDALLEWAKDAIQHLSDGSLTGYYESLANQDLIDKLNSL